MAVVPEDATAALAEAVHDNPNVKVYQHGFRHRNHRRCNGKASEFPAHRETETVAQELTAGWERLQDLFGGQLEPILVPPWGHIAASMVNALPPWGYRGLSRFDPRALDTVPGLVQVNAHCDLIKWRPEPHFRGEAKCLWHLVNHLQGRRSAGMDTDEPTGVLTHAYDMDPACYAFLEDLFGLTLAHSAAEWLQPKDVFPSLPSSAADCSV
jgi:hypothetical protein